MFCNANRIEQHQSYLRIRLICSICQKLTWQLAPEHSLQKVFHHGFPETKPTLSDTEIINFSTAHFSQHPMKDGKCLLEWPKTSSTSSHHHLSSLSSMKRDNLILSFHQFNIRLVILEFIVIKHSPT